MDNIPTNPDKKILLIEDEFLVRDLYLKVLSKSGFNVITATDGEEGLRCIQDQPDLVLLDIMLPKINGIDILRKIKTDPKLKYIPVVLLTNLGQREVIEEAFKIGAQGYILKLSITPYDLVNHVRNFIKNPGLKMDLNKIDLE